MYPTTCQGRVFPQRGPAVVCGELLLESRSGKQRPIKPYVYSSFVDYLTGMLADADIDETKLERPPHTLRGPASELVRHVVQLPGALLCVMDTERATESTSD